MKKAYSREEAYKKLGISEGGIGTAKLSSEPIPAKAKSQYELNGHSIVIGKDKNIYIDTNEYHSGYICLSKKTLKLFLKRIEKKKKG